MKATRVFINGEVFTSDHRFSVHEAVAIGGNRILGVGTNQKIQAFVESGTEGDRPGRTDVDAGVHRRARPPRTLRNESARLKRQSGPFDSELLDQLLLAAEDIPKGQWIRGWGITRIIWQNRDT